MSRATPLASKSWSFRAAPAFTLSHRWRCWMFAWWLTLPVAVIVPDPSWGVGRSADEVTAGEVRELLPIEEAGSHVRGPVARPVLGVVVRLGDGPTIGEHPALAGRDQSVVRVVELEVGWIPIPLGDERPQEGVRVGAEGCDPGRWAPVGWIPRDDVPADRRGGSRSATRRPSRSRRTWWGACRSPSMRPSCRRAPRSTRAGRSRSRARCTNSAGRWTRPRRCGW
jgi:hypothetical protein